jgi:hypothetical protein
MASSTEELQTIPIFATIKKIMALEGFKEAMTMAGVSEEDHVAVSTVLNDSTAVVFSIARVIKRQCEKTARATEFIADEDADRVITTIKKCLNTLIEHNCTICGLPGHDNSYCWVNGQVYGICRAKGPEAQEANFLWRGALKIR